LVGTKFNLCYTLHATRYTLHATRYTLHAKPMRSCKLQNPLLL